jgi:hypothetical protein
MVARAALVIPRTAQATIMKAATDFFTNILNVPLLCQPDKSAAGG